MSLDLPDSPHMAVFDIVVRVLKDNADLARVVRAWRVFSGARDEGVGWGHASTPGIRMAPTIAERGFGDVVSLESDLVIATEIATAGTDLRDQTKIYRAIKMALYPRYADWRRQFQDDLMQAGAYPPIVNFGGLDYTIGETGVMVGRTKIIVTIRESINT